MSNSKIIVINDQQELESIIESSKACVIDFYASWCKPCKELGKHLAKMVDDDNKYTNVTVCKLDIDNSELSEFVTACDITSIPRMVFYKNGEVVGDIVGLKYDEITAKMEELDSN